MRMDKSKFVKIAASIGVSSFLLTGCADNDEESAQKESSAVKTDGTKQESKQEALNCDDKAPTTENIEKEELCRDNNSPASFNNESSHLPILPFVAGYLLASKTSNMYSTAKPNLTKKPYANNIIPYREKDERRSGGYYGGTSRNNDSSKKVDLNKEQPNSSNKVTTDSNTSKSSTTQTPKVNSGSSGIGNAKAPAGS
ncbi:hypothetical protein CQZ94_08440 [Bacillus sp. MYb209]|uniref:hypothetical protein n=1 Tax=Bacillus sp. MYb209 TaxID=1848605 RepID=UPI000CFD240D|nr:hypothetical protein [Bacillus sp. MYb209]PQZ57848.1 hypothetical protein CQZ94_08440 [Bacillus sp. MYb209]